MNWRLSMIDAGLKAASWFLVLALTTWSSSAYAQSFANQAPRPFEIPPQSVSSALLQFSETTNQELMMDERLTRGKQSQGVSGTYTPEAALEAILAGTGLTYRLTTDGAVTVIEAPVSAATPQSSSSSQDADGTPVNVDQKPVKVPEVIVKDVKQLKLAELTTLAPDYPGGQVASGGQVGILGNRNIMDTPFNQISYTSQLMKDQHIRSIGDVLNNDPTARSNTFASGENNFNIRGFGIDNGSVLFNGLQGVSPATNDAVMVESLERVEVFKGPSTLLNGIVGNVGGAINVIPKRAGDNPLIQITPDFTSNSQFGGHIDIGRRFGRNNEFGIRVNGVYRNGGTPIDRQSREQKLATVALDYRGRRLRLSTDLGFQEQHVKGVRRVTLLAPNVPVPEAPDASSNWFDPNEFSQARVLYGAARGEYDFTDWMTAFVGMGGSMRNQVRFTTDRLITDALGNLASDTLTFANGVDKIDTYTLEGGLRGRFDTGPVRHQTTLAYTIYNFYRQRGPLTGESVTFPASNIYNPIFGPSLNSSANPGYDAPVQKAVDDTQSSFTFADTLSILNERVQLTAGFRLQNIKSTNFNTSTGAIFSEYDKQAVSPSVGLVVKPRQNISLYANYIQGLQQGPVAPLTAVNGGEVFAPFAAEQAEFGAKIDFGRLATTLAFYQIALPSAFIDPNTNIFGVDGEQRHRGIDLNFFGEVVNGVRLLGGVAYIDSELTKTQGGLNNGNRGVGVPEWRAVVGTEWDTPFIPRLTMTGRVIRNGSSFYDRGNTQPVSGWTRVDIGARYRIEHINGKAIVIRGWVENLFDASYWDNTIGSQLWFSQPRTFLLSATFDF